MASAGRARAARKSIMMLTATDDAQAKAAGATASSTVERGARQQPQAEGLTLRVAENKTGSSACTTNPAGPSPTRRV
eukprot:scaffold44084_cov35-Phaeocystis_antarctica.AAC.3